MVTAEDVKRIARPLPRTEEALVHDQVKFRVRGIVYLALSRDEQSMGVAFPKEERAAVVRAEPEKFALPRESDMRFRWIHVKLAALDHEELHVLVIEAWRMVVPKFLAAQHLSRPGASGTDRGSSG
ncbi:MAG: MmcQ/YjbR family DNA-binding protein [Thermocrispum sp.]